MDQLGRHSEKFTISEDAEFSTIMVPTGYTAQLSYMCQTLLTHGLRPLVCGPTGRVKVSVVKCVTSELDQSKYKLIQLGFSAKTSAHMTQDIIDGADSDSSSQLIDFNLNFGKMAST